MLNLNRNNNINQRPNNFNKDIKREEFYKPNYDIEKVELEAFMSTFQDIGVERNRQYGHRKYMIELQKVADGESSIVEISLDDIDSFFATKNEELSKRVRFNTKRYINIFSEIVDKLLPQKSFNLNTSTITSNPLQKYKIEDIYLTQRLANLAILSNKDNVQGKDPTWTELDALQREKLKSHLPPEMYRKFEIIFVPGTSVKDPYTPLRLIKANSVGSFVNIKAIVVRISEVRPFIKIATYSCEECGYETYQTISGKVFMPLVQCEGVTCKKNKSMGKIFLNTRGSKFLKFQEIKVQEPPEQVPVGHVPRSTTVLCYGNNVDQCTPGDLVSIAGIYLPNILSGPGKSYKSKLIHDTYIESFVIKKLKGGKKKQGNNEKKEEDLFREFEELKREGGLENLYSKLASSIAPEIFGLDDVKKAILLQLVGGETKVTKDGMKIRGGVNILLMGDPGVAKSQLLKYVVNLSNRGIYTTGKGSSGVGLTAAVVKDPLTNDFILEGGALVMADNGICCIDEFDKMSDYDRSNIYEVMEQQTISIAKAGITTRLNARTSILAAANPLYGRYNKKISPYANINLPAALLSRFDVVFLLLDGENNKSQDEELANHILTVHQLKTVKPMNKDIFSIEFVRRYIEEAKKFNPVIPKDLHNFIIQKYVEKRKEDRPGNQREGHQYITPRSLLAIIRLSLSLARLRLASKVEQMDINEAIKLTEVSRNTVNNIVEEPQETKFRNVQDTLYVSLKNYCEDSKTIKRIDFENKSALLGFKKDDINKFIEDYVNFGVIMVDKSDEIVLI